MHTLNSNLKNKREEFVLHKNYDENCFSCELLFTLIITIYLEEGPGGNPPLLWGRNYLDTAVGGGADRLTGVGAVLQHPEHNHVWLVCIAGSFTVDVHLTLIKLLGNSKSHEKLQDYTIHVQYVPYIIIIKFRLRKLKVQFTPELTTMYLKIKTLSCIILVPNWRRVQHRTFYRK